MALSETVLTSMRDAESHLRNALSFASRLIADIDNIICADEMIDKIEHREFGSSGTFGTFFETDE